jgi:hypothetical protein
MINTFQLVAIPASLIFAVLAVGRRTGGVTRRQSVFWVFLWMSAAIVIALPNIASWAARLVGIGRGADLVLYILAFACILLVRYFYHKQRRMEIVLTELVRRDAIAMATPGTVNNERDRSR